MKLHFTPIKPILTLAVLALTLTLTSQVEAGFVSFSVSPSATSVTLVGGSTPPGPPEVTVTFTSGGPYNFLATTTPTTVLLGTLTRSAFTNGTGTDSEDFDLTIQQTAPSLGNDAFDGVLNATFLHPASLTDTVAIAFSDTTFTLGTVTYQLMLDAAGTNPWVANTPYIIPGGTSGLSVYVSVTDSNVDPILAPEPGSLVLFGMGVVGLIGYGYRNRRRNDSV